MLKGTSKAAAISGDTRNQAGAAPHHPHTTHASLETLVSLPMLLLPLFNTPTCWADRSEAWPWGGSLQRKRLWVAETLTKDSGPAPPEAELCLVWGLLWSESLCASVPIAVLTPTGDAVGGGALGEAEARKVAPRKWDECLTRGSRDPPNLPPPTSEATGRRQQLGDSALIVDQQPSETGATENFCFPDNTPRQRYSVIVTQGRGCPGGPHCLLQGGKLLSPHH